MSTQTDPLSTECLWSNSRTQTRHKAIAPHWSLSYPEYLSPDQDKEEQQRVVWSRLHSHRANLASRLLKQKECYLTLCQELNPRTTQAESSHEPLFRDTAGGGGKLGGNPPRVFDGTHSEADTFMNEFNLYHLTNIGADQVDIPMKRAALLLGFIQGENVKDWVKRWIIWSLNLYNTGLNPNDELYWNTIAGAFETAFQDTGTTEHAEEKLCHLAFTPGEMDGFIAKFKSLANEAGYLLNNRSTITLFALKLPYQMMNHLYKIVHPHDFAGWANGVHQYHQDNQAVQNIKDIHGDMSRYNGSWLDSA